MCFVWVVGPVRQQLGLTELGQSVVVGERREFRGVFRLGDIREIDGGKLLGGVGSRLTGGVPGVASWAPVSVPYAPVPYVPVL